MTNYILKKLLFISLGLILAVLAFFSFKVINFYKKIYFKQTQVVKKVEEKKEKTTFNFLLLGYGGPGHDGAYLTDTIIVAHLDLKKKKVNLISIPRDSWVKVPTKSGDDFYSKINALYQMALFPKKYPDIADQYRSPDGASQLVGEAVNQITGLKIDNFAAIDFAGFEKIIDILGGVDIKVEKTFDDYQYPITGKEADLCGHEEAEIPELDKQASRSPQLVFPCRYEHLHFDAGLNHMNGERALKYVRSRHSLQDGSDFGRARRQQLLLEALKNKVLKIGFVTKIAPLLDELGSHIKTDISLEMIKKLLTEAALNGGKYRKKTLVISPKNVLKSSYSAYGGYILIPKDGIDNWQAAKQLIQEFIAGVKPTLTPTVKKTISQ